MKNGRCLVVLGFLTAAAAGPATAQGLSGLYVGGSFGFGQYKETCSRALVPCDANDETWRVFAGYQFNPYVAAEIGYADLGAASGTGPLPGGFQGSFKSAVKDAFDLSALFSFPATDRLSVLLRAGMYHARTTVDQDGTFPGAPLHDAGTNSGFSVGLGAEFRFGPVGVRAEWQHYQNVGVAATGEDDIDVIGVGLLFRF